jgi:tetratricopeptide (TPR) repeat protein
MLSAFRAQPILELKSRDKSKIEALLAYGDRIFVGLNTGALRIYRTDDETAEVKDEVPQTPTKTRSADCLHEDEKFSKKPVQQLAFVKEAKLLVSLSDGVVSLHDLQTYQLVERLERTKGASCFAVTSSVVTDPETDVPSLVSRLAIAVKRKLLFWTWQDMEQSPEISEISMEATIKSIIWVDGVRLIVGMDPGFSTVNVLTEETTPILKQSVKPATDGNPTELAGTRFGTVTSSGMGYMGMASWVPKPMATGMFGDQVLLAKDVNTLFIDGEGNALDKRQIPWAVAPEAIGFSYPYLLALQAPDKGALHIRNPDTLSLLQSLSVPGATVLHVPQPNISLAHLGKGFLVASDRIIWRMGALPYHTQLVELVEHQRFDEAISLLQLLEDTLIDNKQDRIHEVMTQKAIALFQQQKYRPALDLFIDAETSPDRVIALYPRVISGAGADADAAEHEGEENREHDGESLNEPPRTPVKGMFGLLKTPRKPESDSVSIKSPARADVDNMSIRTAKTVNRAPDKPLEGEDLKLAVRCLCSFLAQARTQLQKFLSPEGQLKERPTKFDAETGKPAFANLLPQAVFEKDSAAVDWQAELLKTAQLVDTALFRAYMLAMPSLAGSLFRIDNFCDPAVVQAALYEGERYNDLIDFLHGKKLHRQALEMLTKFGKGEADGEIPAGMQGPERIVGYLKQLPPELVDVILEFVQWPIQVRPEVGMEVFVADTDNAERLPRDQVLKFLADHDNRLEIQYLEHIINELGERAAEFHQRLVDVYVAELKRKDVIQEEQERQKTKLEEFLVKSRTYNKAKTFKLLPAHDPLFYQIRAIVLSAMGNHKQALSIYVFQIQNYEKAEDYCNQVYLEDQMSQQACLVDGGALHEKQFKQFEPENTIEKPNIFAILLGLYLSPPAEEQKRWPQALDLLSKHGARLPTSSTLELMPDDLAVQQLHDYFLGRVRNATSMLREEAIVRNLEGVRRAKTERLLVQGPDLGPSDVGLPKPQGRNRRVRIGEDDHCRLCHKRFTAATAIRVYPDDEPIHYGCITRSGNSHKSEGGMQTVSGSGGLGAMRQRSGAWGDV